MKLWRNLKYLAKYDLRKLLEDMADNTVREFDGDLKHIDMRINDLFVRVEVLEAQNHPRFMNRLAERIKALEDMDGNFKHLDKQIHGLFERVEALEEANKPKTLYGSVMDKIFEAACSTGVSFTKVEAEDVFKPDILQRDPVDLFKEDRVPHLTSKAITLMRYWQLVTVEQLIEYRPSFFMSEKGIGKQTVGYIQSVLGRHGLSLKGE